MFQGINFMQSVGLDYSHWTHSAAAVVHDDLLAAVALVAIAIIFALIVVTGGSWSSRRRHYSSSVTIMTQQPTYSFLNPLSWNLGSSYSRREVRQPLPAGGSSYTVIQGQEHSGNGSGATSRSNVLRGGSSHSQYGSGAVSTAGSW